MSFRRDSRTFLDENPIFFRWLKIFAGVFAGLLVLALLAASLATGGLALPLLAAAGPLLVFGIIGAAAVVAGGLAALFSFFKFNTWRKNVPEKMRELFVSTRTDLSAQMGERLGEPGEGGPHLTPEAQETLGKVVQNVKAILKDPTVTRENKRVAIERLLTFKESSDREFHLSTSSDIKLFHVSEWRDLSGVDLSDMDLRGLDLSNFSLSGSNLSNATLTETKPYRANFDYANLSGADLRGVSFKSDSLVGANLANVIINQETTFEGVNLDGALCFTIWKYLSHEQQMDIIHNKGRENLFSPVISLKGFEEKLSSAANQKLLYADSIQERELRIISSWYRYLLQEDDADLNQYKAGLEKRFGLSEQMMMMMREQPFENTKIAIRHKGRRPDDNYTETNNLQSFLDESPTPEDDNQARPML